MLYDVRACWEKEIVVSDLFPLCFSLQVRCSKSIAALLERKSLALCSCRNTKPSDLCFGAATLEGLHTGSRNTFFFFFLLSDSLWMEKDLSLNNYPVLKLFLCSLNCVINRATPP